MRWPAIWSRIGTGSIGLIAAGAVGAQVLRAVDNRRAERTRLRLLSLPRPKPLRFEPTMVEGLPGPAQRYFLFSIASGTWLSTVAEIEMVGEIGLGTKESPRYMAMRASQVLAPPDGFVWTPAVGSGLLRMSGSDCYADGNGWTRFWLSGLVPVARAGGTADMARSAAARGIAEAVFWVPAALLPQNGVTWEAVGADTARAVVEHRGERFILDLTTAADGRPKSVVMQRWSRENPQRVWRLQPFGGTVLEVGRFGGYTLATRIEGGNHFGTPDYFPFYRVRVTDIRLR